MREELNESGDAYVQGTDTTGKYSNAYLLIKLNQSYRTLFAMLVQRIPGYFYAKATITGTSSVFTLPGDMGVIAEIRDDQGYKVVPVTVGNIPINDGTGSKNEYLRTGNSITVNKDGVTGPYVFYYRKKARDLQFGAAAAGAATSITFPTSFSKVADYYNGMELNNITKDWTDTITDYSVARVATILETAAASDYFGLVPEIPEAFQHLIAPKAVQLVKAGFPIAQEKPTQSEIMLWNDMLAEAIKVYGVEDTDVNLGDAISGYQ